MNAIFEGSHQLEAITGLCAVDAKRNLKSFLTNRTLNSAQFSVLETLTLNSIDAIEKQLNLVQEHRLEPAGWSVDVEWTGLRNRPFDSCQTEGPFRVERGSL